MGWTGGAAVFGAHTHGGAPSRGRQRCCASLTRLHELQAPFDPHDWICTESHGPHPSFQPHFCSQHQVRCSHELQPPSCFMQAWLAGFFSTSIILEDFESCKHCKVQKVRLVVAFRCSLCNQQMNFSMCTCPLSSVCLKEESEKQDSK